MKRSGLILLLVAISLLFGCSEKTQYEKMVERELSKDIQRDSLFLGYELGMSKKEFFDHSWELNKKKMVRQGPNNQSVKYKLEDLPHAANMYFYPEFHDEKVYQMKVRVKYTGWAPWNKDLSADSLQLDVVNMLKSWYGDGFISMKVEKGDSLYVKVDGNREIRVANRGNDAAVWVYFTDLAIKRKIEKNGKS